MLFHPKISNGHDKIGNLECKWVGGVGVYRIENVLTKSNYLIRKTNTNHTKIVHLVRLKPFQPQLKSEDLPLSSSEKLGENSMIPDAVKGPQIFDSQVENIIYKTIDNRSTAQVKIRIQQQVDKKRRANRKLTNSENFIK